MQSSLKGMDLLHEISSGDSAIRIAVLDGPVALSHSCFVGGTLVSVPTISGNSSGMALSHGTAVASILFGQQDTSVRGISPKCTGLIAPVFDDGPDGSTISCSQLNLARAIEQCVQMGAHIINISGGQFEPSAIASTFLADALSLCQKSGVLVAAAAGNEGCACTHVPAATESVLVVGAMDSIGLPLDFSNWGEAYMSHGVLTLGENIKAATIDGSYTSLKGTSFATPIVSGVAALLLSIQFANGLQPDPLFVGQTILATAIPCSKDEIADCSRMLKGKLNIEGALRKIMEDILRKKNNIPESFAQKDLERRMENDLNGECTPLSTFTELRDRTPAGQVHASSCSCGCKGNQLVYVLGEIGYDFASEARRDSFTQQMPLYLGRQALPYDPASLLAYLDERPFEANAILWTLSLDATAIYAMVPSGPFAETAFSLMQEFLRQKIEGAAQRVSIPGVIKGSTKLLNGQVVPVIVPAIRGMFSWSTSGLVEYVLGEVPKEKQNEEYDERKLQLNGFLDRVYNELRNLGVTPQDRALNYAATNCYQVESVFRASAKEAMELDSIDVERSPICRPESDCWDVKMVFFNPRNRTEQARKVYRFTVDVSDTLPVSVGMPRSYYLY